MPLFAWKNPDPYTRAIKIYSDTSPGLEYEQMAETEFSDWLASQSQPPPAPEQEPEPEPNWQEFTNGILNENGYVAAHQAAADSTDLKVKFAAAGIFAALVKFQSSGDFVDYLTALSFVVSAADDPVKLVEEFIGLAQRCHLPADFIAAVGAIISQSPPPE